jgi:hypothetical protein
MSVTQLKGNLTMGLADPADIDISAWVTRLTVQRLRESIAIPGTLATGQASVAAGAETDNLIVDFFSDFTADAPFDLFEDAIMTANSELWFSGTLDPGATSPTNPMYSGVAILLGIDIGGTVGQLRTQSQVLPIKAGTLIKATT